MRVAIYCRVSTEDQKLNKQYMICKAFADRNGHEIYKEYSDIISGT